MTQPRVSITFTALIWTGIVLCIAGFIITALGLGGVTLFEAGIGDFTVKTTNSGLALIVIGAALSYFVSRALPTGVAVLGNDPTREEPTLREKPIRILPMVALVIGTIALFILIVSILA
jgi:formate hydrogenlyase subunit 3/multisubunit Na+/H+ antiporter MnhD subunit